MGIHRTALGKSLDMAALIAKNERVRAVSNQSVNARGDTIDSFGRVIVPVTQKTGDNYAQSVKNKSAQVKQTETHNPVDPAIVTEPKTVISQELTESEKEFENDLEREELEIAKLKSQENKK